MNSLTLEHKLFQSGMKYGLVLLAVLLFHDIFVVAEWFSVLFEVLAFIIMVANLILLKKRPPSDLQILLFGLFVVPLVNFGWLTGGGVNLLNASIYFITSSMLMLLMNKRYYIGYGIVVFLNLLLLYYLEGVADFELFGISMAENNEALNRDYLYSAILFFFGGFLIAFTKVNYNRDREKLSELNLELQNAQQTLHETVSELEEQKAELAQIRDLLEIKVYERTQDLAQANDRLLTKNQQLEQYSYIISHNLKAPVAQIKGLTHLLPINESFDKLTKETIDRLQDSALNLEKVLTDLSAVLRVEKNLQQEWEQISLQQVLDEVIDSLKNAMRERGVKYTHDATALPTILAIKPYVYSVLHNIIENAVKYSDPTKKAKHLKIEFTELPRYYQLSLTDNGIGIDMEAASGKIFQMYQRFNTTHPGQGFGLYLVKTQMEAINGHVELESMLGQGTTFKLYFNKQQ
jgi:signal transduction histidine kinase